MRIALLTFSLLAAIGLLAGNAGRLLPSGMVGAVARALGWGA